MNTRENAKDSKERTIRVNDMPSYYIIFDGIIAASYEGKYSYIFEGEINDKEFNTLSDAGYSVKRQISFRDGVHISIVEIGWIDA